jgi:outer membrane protein
MKNVISIVTLLLLSSYMVTAQQVLTLKDAVNYALKNKLEAVNARLDVENSEFLIQETRAAVLPQINAQAGVTHNIKLQQMALDLGGQTMIVRMGQPWVSSPVLSLNQQLFNMSAFQGLKAAKSTREFYALNAELTEEQVIEKVITSYYEVYKTKTQLATLDSTVANTTRVRDVIGGLVDNGLAKKIDLDRMNVTLSNLNSNKIQLNSALELQENALKYLIGMDISAPIELEEKVFEAPAEFTLVKEDFNIENRKEMQVLSKQGELLHYQKKAIEAAYYPTLSLGANYGYYAMGDRFPYLQGDYKGVSGSDFAAVSLTLNIPIFNGFQVRSKVSQAQIQILQYEAQMKDVKLALNLAVENALTRINNSVLTLNSQRENMILAKEVLENIENNYKNGLASLTDLIDAETSYVSSQNNYTNALVDFKVAEVELLKAKGELKSYFTQSNN